jgi:hypothetical protein
MRALQARDHPPNGRMDAARDAGMEAQRADLRVLLFSANGHNKQLALTPVK